MESTRNNVTPTIKSYIKQATSLKEGEYMPYNSYLEGLLGIINYPRMSPSFQNIPHLRSAILEDAEVSKALFQFMNTGLLNWDAIQEYINSGDDDDWDGPGIALEEVLDRLVEFCADYDVRKTWGISAVIRESLNIVCILIDAYYASYPAAWKALYGLTHGLDMKCSPTTFRTNCTRANYEELQAEFVKELENLLYHYIEHHLFSSYAPGTETS